MNLLAVDEDQSRDTDVLIIGGGIAGLLLASRLRKRKLRVAVLESGDREQLENTHSLNEVIQVGDSYSGATHGRFRCLGGTSTRWGGALIPFAAHDFESRPYLGLGAWPVGIQVLQPYLTEVENLFGVDGLSYEEDFVQNHRVRHVPTGDADFKARFAKWPAFRRRNMAVLLKDIIERDTELEIWINSTATNFNLDVETGRLRSVTGREYKTGRSITISAEQFVICAGAIESTRLLLVINHNHDGHVFRDCDALGRFFFDHISMPLARIRVKSAWSLNRMAGLRFPRSTMRSLRFELSPAAQERERIGGAFVHISFQTDKPTGFDILRQLLRYQQKDGRISPQLLLNAIHDLPYMFKLVAWRILYNQLFWPLPAIYKLHGVIEQLPSAENYIGLARRKDLFDLPMAAINWHVSQAETDAFVAVMRCFDWFWKRQRLDRIGELQWSWSGDSAIGSGGDVYHPGGTTRMGTNRRSAVVDPNLTSFAIPNLSVCSTSAFPTGGSSNPTLMLMLFAMRLADRLCSIPPRAYSGLSIRSCGHHLCSSIA